MASSLHRSQGRLEREYLRLSWDNLQHSRYTYSIVCVSQHIVSLATIGCGIWQAGQSRNIVLSAVLNGNTYDFHGILCSTPFIHIFSQLVEFHEGV